MTEEEEDKYKRALATIENMRKQNPIAVARAREQAEEQMAFEVMAAIDDFQRGVDALRQKGVRKQQVIGGVDIALNRLIGSLMEYGIVRIQTVGQPFDPRTMEAVTRVQSTELPHNQVVGEVCAGYQRKGRLLRPAQVAVIANLENANG